MLLFLFALEFVAVYYAHECKREMNQYISSTRSQCVFGDRVFVLAVVNVVVVVVVAVASIQIARCYLSLSQYYIRLYIVGFSYSLFQCSYHG